jgi:endonuclease-3
MAAKCRVREALESLPGVGRKTANVVLNTAFGQTTVAVDTHIFRVANRTGVAPARIRARSKTSCSSLSAGIPAQHAPLADPARPLRAALRRKPGCPECLIRDLCEFRGKTKKTKDV